jgi:hypothetical protein
VRIADVSKTCIDQIRQTVLAGILGTTAVAVPAHSKVNAPTRQSEPRVICFQSGVAGSRLLCAQESAHSPLRRPASLSHRSAR